MDAVGSLTTALPKGKQVIGIICFPFGKAVVNDPTASIL